MPTERRERHIAAIMSADVVGYSHLMELDEADTHARFAELLDKLIEPAISHHRGHVFKTMGDGLLVEFDSVVDAVDCAVAMQMALQEYNRDFEEDRQIRLRIGVNLGDVIVEGEDRFGEGVILASRLQGLADPGGVLISQPTFQQLASHQKMMFEDGGTRSLKNVSARVHVYGWMENPIPIPRSRKRFGRKALAGVAMALVLAIALVAMRFLPDEGGDLPPLPAGPKIAVLPFYPSNGGSESAQLANGLSESISADLSKFTDLFVLSFNATRQLQSGQVNPQLVLDELGASYMLEGTLRRSDGQLRVTARLVDTKDARLLWSQTYDRDLSANNIFDVLDEITIGVVATIGSQSGVVRLREAGRIRAKRTDNLSAYECVALYDYHGINVSRADRARVRDCLEKAVKLDPHYATAWAHLAGILIETHKNDALPENEAQMLLNRADAAAKRASELDNANSEAYYRRAIVSQLRGEGYDAFKELSDKAIALNPNSADMIGDIGNFSYYSGDLERGKALVERMMEINPLYPSWAHYVFFLDHFRNQRYPEALSEVVKITLPSHCLIQWSKAAAYGKVGDLANGQATLDHIEKIDPPCPDDPRVPYLKRGLPEELVAEIMDGLRLAGLQQGSADK